MNAKEAKRIIDGYFDSCAENGSYPDEAGMLLALGYDREKFEGILAGKSNSGLRRAILAARLRRESLLTREIFATEKPPTGKIFLSRQGSAGALTDKPRESAEPPRLEVVLSGDTSAFE